MYRPTSNINTSISYICLQCGKPISVQFSVTHSSQANGDISLEANASIELCPVCDKAHKDLIRDLWNALSWEKRGQFDSPILDDMEREMRVRQGIEYMGVAV